MIVHLEEWEWRHAMHVAAARTTANWKKEDASQYQGNKNRMEDNRTNNERACVCELAVAKATNRYWSGSEWPSDRHDDHKDKEADVGTNIEVRCIRTRKAFKIKEASDVGKGRILFGTETLRTSDGKEELKTVKIYGWIAIDKAWEELVNNNPPDYINKTEEHGFRTREVPIEMLHPLEVDEKGNYIDKRDTTEES